MLRKILSISGRPGLFRLVNQGKNMLIVESLATGKRTPAYARDKVMSLGDISIYTNDGGDTPLAKVLEAVREANEGKAVDIKAIGGEKELREYFATIMPDYDEDRVYGSDIRKIFQWYNQLLEAGFTTFVAEEEAEETASEE
ncbi:MAG: hypothetical protein C7K11_02190 [Candidatus Amulumruptor caecigallinarius]|uniref:DUF5606 domain-containing protein n=1 Tax=Candidatus Amulumruptor caecigallinarius TaxID=2109911 RepID=A0A4Q0UAP4_9BACT|nr:MAG: hypothetical protein C7K11_02190 [Candidatus Amulumruptor caecigallinarius]HJE39081.1 DUF5606 domain-containing protein [Candidatus Amulumruptor caecigallinarius]